MFMYRHRRTNNWVVALWLDKTAGVFLEVLVVGPDPNCFPPALRAKLHKRLSSPGDPRHITSEIAKVIRKEESDDTTYWGRYGEDTGRYERDLQGVCGRPFSHGWTPPDRGN
jgi:hypothetical protein